MSLKRLQMEDLFFGQKETGAERVAMATALRASFCFFCDGQLWCQVSRTLVMIMIMIILIILIIIIIF